ncbi:hypothetical protein [Deinococcus aquaedulcis]|uniref:hypothetical protein n=1 Tax=Deinococcus aquaedulcis TaxID=2840455 RepID=UPI001C8298DC|nr:hypothetical protein [Deinococcus aquaedulcis]
MIRLSRSLPLLGLLVAAWSAAQPRGAATAAPCPESWSALNPATLRAARVTAVRAVLTDARGAPVPLGLSSGELVLQGPAVAGRRCTYVPGEAGRSGTLNAGDTEPLPLPAALETGTWERDANAGLTLKAKDASGALTLTGSAVFPTAGGSVNVGHLNGPLRRADSPRRWLYADGDCALTLWPLGPWLLVQDNQKCGGLNVTFAGLYRHVR